MCLSTDAFPNDLNNVLTEGILTLWSVFDRSQTAQHIIHVFNTENEKNRLYL